MQGVTKWISSLICIFVVFGCADQQKITTISPGVLAVAVTSESPNSQYDPQLWIRRYVEKFAVEKGLHIDWIVVPFDQSWALAGNNVVDMVATNVASFSDRVVPGSTFSDPFLYERRALRIRPADAENFKTIDDFAGKKVGVVAGMAAEIDVNRRAPSNVDIVKTLSFAELYSEFEAGRLDAVAEAEYYDLTGEVIPSHGGDVVLIDHHDLNPGSREESVFVIRDESGNLLENVNLFISKTHFPL